ncbi:MAG: TolC family protein [Deltaproteobacteria bacterium]|nr:TolC family protein [Deltaproteobacteria bacterium]
MKSTRGAGRRGWRAGLAAWVKFLFFILLVAPAVSFAGEGGLSLNDAWRLALKYNEQIAIAAESMERSALDIDRAYSRLLPDITLEGSYTRYSDKKSGEDFLIQPRDSSRFDVRVTQSIYGGGRELSGLRQAKKTRLLTEKAAREVREAIVMDTALAYYGLLKAEKEFGIREASLKRAGEQLRVARARLEAGSATKADVLRAEAEESEKTAQFVKASAGRKDAEELLRRIIGIEGPSWTAGWPARPAASGSGFSVDKGVDELVEIAFDKRKDYQQKHIAEDIAREGITYAKGYFLPNLSLEGVYSHRDQSPKTGFFLDESAYATVTLSLPVFEGGLRKAELSQARSRLRQAELERIGLKREVALEVRRAHNAMETSSKVMDAYKKQAAFAGENYTVVFKQYQYGLASASDLVGADTTLVAAELGLTGASYDYELAVIGVKRSVGTLLEDAENSLALEAR